MASPSKSSPARRRRANASKSNEPASTTDAVWAPLLTPDEASEFLKIEKSTLAVWRSTGRVLLPFLKLGGHVRYRPEDVQRFLAERTHGTADAMKPIRSRRSASVPSASLLNLRRAVVQAKAKYSAKYGSLRCEACGFDPAKEFKGLAHQDDCISVSHVRALVSKSAPKGQRPRLLCAKCHRLAFLGVLTASNERRIAC